MGTKTLKYATFNEWTRGREVPFLCTNAGAPALPFQCWRHFKEAFTPELVSYALDQCRRPVSRCLDPFGGSGTTALSCQFLGVHPVIVEVNPYLADLIEAKLVRYDCDILAHELGKIINLSLEKGVDIEVVFGVAPKTFVEPGLSGRWVFDRAIAKRLAAYLQAIDEIENEAHRRLFRVLLGGLLIQVSNVVINGKGRRYRPSWQTLRRDPHEVDALFSQIARQAIIDIYRYARRAYGEYEVLRGDSRQLLTEVQECDIAIFSPPYPNSFDYTDVYNIELWTLGYLTDSASNRQLRMSTLSSHVQVAREFASPPNNSPLLNKGLERLNDAKTRLWDKHLPEMVGGYFADMTHILTNIYALLSKGGEVWMVVGDSQYDKIHIQTANILCELSTAIGYQVKRCEPFRSMRSSAQQGGRAELAETLLVLNQA